MRRRSKRVNPNFEEDLEKFSQLQSKAIELDIPPKRFRNTRSKKQQKQESTKNKVKVEDQKVKIPQAVRKVSLISNSVAKEKKRLEIEKTVKILIKLRPTFKPELNSKKKCFKSYIKSEKSQKKNELPTLRNIKPPSTQNAILESANFENRNYEQLISSISDNTHNLNISNINGFQLKDINYENSRFNLDFLNEESKASSSQWTDIESIPIA